MNRLALTLGALSSALCNTSLANTTVSGSVGFEQRYFFQSESSQTEQINQFLGRDTSSYQSSVTFDLEVNTEWNKGKDQLIFQPYIRLDEQDDERSHFDIRQLLWTHLESNWELSAGIGIVFWGVTESQHLVDIINQTDLVENIDGEDKLGQPMIRYSYFSDYGSVDAFLLPGFRTRTFSGADSRLNGGFEVDNDNEIYESDAEQGHLDFALRYSHTIGDWGIGLSWFSGTSREADLLRFADLSTGTTTPFYPQIDQFGADIQITTDAWLIKLEAIQRNHSDPFIEDFAATTVGAEYTFVGVFGSVYDIGALAEYSWDERGETATSIFQNDIFLGARLAFNDINESTLLLGFSNDLDNTDSRTVFIEAATRINASITSDIELRYFESGSDDFLLVPFDDDSFIQLNFEYHF